MDVYHIRPVLIASLVALQGSQISGAQFVLIANKGNSRCPCINVEDVIQEKGMRCELEDGTMGALFSQQWCYPTSYGSGHCRPWEGELADACRGEDDNLPAFCLSHWCYIDRSKCHSSDHTYYRSKSVQGLYWSYSTCGSNEETWFSTETTSALNNSNLTVVLARIEYPKHYKLNSKGELVESGSPDAYDPAIPWEGVLIDYFNDVMGISNVNKVTYDFRSKGSEKKSIASTFTQAVSDVEAEIADVAIGTLWITAERLEMTPFTVPIIRDTFKLWVKSKHHESQETKTVVENFQKLKQPFSNELWLAIVFAIGIYAVLSAYVSPKKFRKFSKRKTSFWGKTKRACFVLTDSVHLSALEFLGGAVDTGFMYANLSQKWLNFGFAIVTFVSITAYTANLAAFLTISGATGLVDSIEEATAQNMRICVNSNMQQELETRYPNTLFVYGADNINVQKDYDEGKCTAILQGWVDIYSAPDQQLWYCKNQLTRVGSSVLEFPIGFSVRPEIAGGLSHWIAQAANKGTHFQEYLERIPQHCPLEYVEEPEEEGVDAGMQQFTLQNMMVPFIGFFISCGFALLIQFWKWAYYRKGDKKKGLRSRVRKALDITSRSIGGSGRQRDREDMKLPEKIVLTDAAHDTNPESDSTPCSPMLSIIGTPKRSSDPQRLTSLEDMNRAMEEFLRLQQEVIMRQQQESMKEILAYQQSLIQRSAEVRLTSSDGVGLVRGPIRRRAVSFDDESNRSEEEEIVIPPVSMQSSDSRLVSHGNLGQMHYANSYGG